MDEPNGEMDINLVTECDNRDLVDFDFRTCEYNTYMCCWPENDGLGMNWNTVSSTTDVVSPTTCAVGKALMYGQHCLQPFGGWSFL